MRTTGNGQSPILLLDVIDVLSEKNVPYAVVGAMAASVHGQVRASLDADAVISLGGTSVEDLATVFRGMGLDVDVSQGDDDDPISLVIVLQDFFENKVDLIAGVRGMSPDAFDRTIVVPLMKQPIRIVGIEDFIAMKIFAGSAQDLMDAENAILVSREKINIDLVRDLVRRYGRRELEKFEYLLHGGEIDPR